MPLFADAILLVLLYAPVRLALSSRIGDKTPLERLCLSAAVSCLVIYLVHMTGLVLRWRFSACQALLLVVAVGALAIRHRRLTADARVIVRSGEWRYLVLLFAASVWMVLLTITQANLSGGGWMGDWWEHYQRMLFYLGHHDPHGAYEFDVTARPPAFNMVAAALAGLIGSTFSDYQVIHTALGSLALIPAVLLFEHFATRGARRTLPLAALALFWLSLLLHPMLATNMLYPWSRMYTTFFMLAGTYWYLTGRFAIAFLCLGTAMTSHYSAAVMTLVISADFLLKWRTRPQRLAILWLAVPLAPWVAWVVKTYGVTSLLISNTTAQNWQGHPLWEVARQWLYNVETTFVPFVRWDDMRPFIAQGSRLGALYDTLHLYWASNFWGSLTTAATLTMAVFFALRLDRQVEIPASAKKLVALSLVAIGASFVIVPNVEVSGISHLSLQHVVIGLFAVCSALISRSPLWLRRLYAVLFVLEAWSFYALKTFARQLESPDAYSIGYRLNWSFKRSHELSFLHDQYPWLAQGLPIAFLAIVPLLYGYLAVKAFGDPQR